MPDLVIVGDINIDLKGRNPNSTIYRNMLKNLGLTQLIMTPTRVTNQSATIIDHILTNREDLYLQGFTVNPGVSDHCLVYTNRKKAKIPRTFHYLKCCSYRNFVDVSFQRDVDVANWERVLNSHDIENASLVFNEILVKIVDRHAPVIRLRMRDFAPHG